LSQQQQQLSQIVELTTGKVPLGVRKIKNNNKQTKNTYKKQKIHRENFKKIL